MKYISDFKSPEFIGFIVCGAVAAAVNVASRIIFDTILQSYIISILLAFIAGLVASPWMTLSVLGLLYLASIPAGFYVFSKLKKEAD